MNEKELEVFLSDLDKQGILFRNEIRKKYEKEIVQNISNERIIMDSRLLEKLLFEEMIIDKKNGIVAKIPVWSGPFLRKIDLSKIDFSNVSWSLFNTLKGTKFSHITPTNAGGFDINLIYDLVAAMQNEACPKINFSNTNASIDLTKSFEANYLNMIYLSNCNLTGMDFSNQDFSNISEFFIWMSDISHTNMTIPKDAKLKSACSNLSGINLSQRKINLVSYLDTGFVYDKQKNYKYTDKNAELEAENNLYYSILNNTGIQVEFNSSEYQKLIDRSCNPNFSDDKKVYDDGLKRAIDERLIGCNINGVLNALGHQISNMESEKGKK